MNDHLKRKKFTNLINKSFLLFYNFLDSRSIFEFPGFFMNTSVYLTESEEIKPLRKHTYLSSIVLMNLWVNIGLWKENENDIQGWIHAFPMWKWKSEHYYHARSELRPILCPFCRFLIVSMLDVILYFIQKIWIYSFDKLKTSQYWLNFPYSFVKSDVCKAWQNVSEFQLSANIFLIF